MAFGYPANTSVFKQLQANTDKQIAFSVVNGSSSFTITNSTLLPHIHVFRNSSMTASAKVTVSNASDYELHITGLWAGADSSSQSTANTYITSAPISKSSSFTEMAIKPLRAAIVFIDRT